MWVNKQQYDELVAAHAVVTASNRILVEQITKYDVTLDWFRIRLTQLEKERAQLIHNYMGIKIEVPELLPVREQGSGVPAHALQDADLFNDMGDDQAQKLGISWHPDGTINYGRSSQRS